MMQQYENNFSLTFYLTAQVDARNAEGLADANTSKLRTDTTLYLYTPLPEPDEKSISNHKATSLTGEDMSSENLDVLYKNMNFNIAGVAGLGAQNVSASIQIDKNTF